MAVSIFLFILLLISISTWSVINKKLTPAAAIAAVIVASSIFAGTGWPGILLLGCFFLIGIWATAWQKEKKKELTGESQQRTAWQVLANGGLAAGCSLLAYFIPAHANFFSLAVAACFSSAIADTTSSELGMVYVKRFYNILTFEKGKKGENGVVSIEGIMIGIAASALIAFLYGLSTGDQQHFIPIVLAGLAGNLADSILGATLERKNIIGNNAVNFLNTLIAVITIWLMLKL